MNKSKASRGVASWFLTVIVLISLLLSVAFGAQNIRLRYQLKNVQDEVTHYTDQSNELESLRTQVETLNKQNQDLSKQMDDAKSQLDKANDEITSLKKRIPSSRSSRRR